MDNQPQQPTPQFVPQPQVPQQPQFQPQSVPPVSPVPPTPPVQPTQQPYVPPQQNQFVTPPMPPQEPRRSSKAPLAFVVLLIFVGLGVGAYFLTSKEKTDSASVVTTVKQLQANGTLESKLTSLNKDDLLLGAVYATSTQQVQHLVSESSTLPSPDSSSFLGRRTGDATIDYASKKFSLTFISKSSPTEKGIFATRCVDGQSYTYLDLGIANLKPKWEVEDSSGGTNSACDYSHINVTLETTDGFNSGGMNATQAQTFTNALQGLMSRGILTADSASIDTHANKKYLKLAAHITPKNNNASKTWYGTQELMFAFKKTGIDPGAHPYRTAGVISAGMKITLYLDPSTMLPAYAEYRTDTGYDKNNKPQTASSFNGYNLTRVQYTFGGSVPTLTTANAPQDIKLSW